MKFRNDWSSNFREKDVENNGYNTYSPGTGADNPLRSVRGQIYLLKITSIYGNFTPIGA